MNVSDPFVSFWNPNAEITSFLTMTPVHAIQNVPGWKANAEKTKILTGTNVHAIQNVQA